jgi:hypothetical protein
MAVISIKINPIEPIFKSNNTLKRNNSTKNKVINKNKLNGKFFEEILNIIINKGDKKYEYYG